MVVEVIVSPDAAGRAERIVAARFPDVPRRVRQQWFIQGLVREDGAVLRKGASVAAGRVIFIHVPDERLEPERRAQPGFATLYDDEDVIVVDKPAGLASAALAGSREDSVAAQLLSLYPAMEGVGYSRWDAGLIHRLDTDTSGVLVAAKSAEVFKELVGALQAGQVTKSYLAWTVRTPEPRRGTVATWLCADSKNARRMVAARAGAKGARFGETEYEVLATEGEFCLVRAHAARATRHQVRAHLASMGCPLAGDTLYGADEEPGPGRHALHAEHVAYRGGAHCRPFSCSAPVPAELARLTPTAVQRFGL